MGNSSHDTCHDTCQASAMTRGWQKDAKTTDNRLKDLRPRPKTVSRPASPGMADDSSPEGFRRSVVTTAHGHHRATRPSGGAR